MRLSKRGEYGLRAMIMLAGTPKPGASLPVVQIRDISEREKIPAKYLEQILLSLKNAGLLHSRMGVGGGYYLARPPADEALGVPGAERFAQAAIHREDLTFFVEDEDIDRHCLDERQKKLVAKDLLPRPDDVHVRLEGAFGPGRDVERQAVFSVSRRHGACLNRTNVL